MSELLEKFNRIKQLPIFPLPVVLLPQEVLPLHIFEPRYRKMLDDVQSENNYFGLSFFDPQTSFTDRPEIGSIGCVAEIKRAETLEDGRSNIVTLGLIRYRLESYVSSDAPYLVGEISAFEDYRSDLEILQALANEVHRLTINILQSGNRMTGSFGGEPKIPASEPQNLSFLVATAVGLSPDEKYALLEMRSTIERLEKMREILKEAIARIAEFMNSQAKTNGNNKKKFDLN